MSTHRTTIEALEDFELRFCFFCDDDGPHYSAEIDGVYLFQCTSCFASHSEPLPEGIAAPGAGRHRAG